MNGHFRIRPLEKPAVDRCVNGTGSANLSDVIAFSIRITEKQEKESRKLDKQIWLMQAIVLHQEHLVFV